MNTEEIFHVGLQHPNDVRKTILESTKEIIYSLQKFEKLKAVRVEKSEQIIRLKKEILELIRLIDIFRKELPKTKLRAKENFNKIEPLKIPNKIKVDDNKESFKEEVNNNNNDKTNELDKLEMELSDIESKLNNLI